VLAANSAKLRHNPEGRRALENISAHCAKILFSSIHPIKLRALRPLWETAPRVELPNSYEMYKALYEQVFYSISSEPLQIVNQEEAVTTLLESMWKSKFKNGKLLNEVSTILTLRGFETQKYGFRMFRALIELESVPFAIQVLDQLLNRENIIVPQRPSTDFLSEEAKQCVEDMLSKVQKPYRTSDLTLALYCFSREDKKSRFYRRLETIEEEMLASQVNGMKIGDVCSILNSYAFCSRKYPGTKNKQIQN
jgi:hypothetical protein